MTVLERRTGPEGALRLLADPTRLRILALLEREELAVGELSRALGMAQSRVSNHLRVLRDAGVLGERHAGTSTYVHIDFEAGDEGGGLARRLWNELRGELEGLPEHGADLVRLEGVLAERGDPGFFDRLAGSWDKVAGGFATNVAPERVAGHLLPESFVVADLGCGTGALGHALLGRAARLIAVDASPGMLEEAERRLGRAARGTEIELRQGELDQLPLADAEVDGCVAGMVLHHLSAPGALDTALAEMRRVLKPGAAAVVLELAPHRESWMRAELGDHHLGLAPADVLAAFTRAGFEEVVLDPVADRYRPTRPEAAGGGQADLELYIVRGRRPRVRMTSPARTSR